MLSAAFDYISIQPGNCICVKVLFKNIIIMLLAKRISLVDYYAGRLYTFIDRASYEVRSKVRIRAEIKVESPPHYQILL